MKLRDQFRFVRQNMKKNRTRVYMTILATAMGCAFLIVLASVGFGLQKSVVKEILEGGIVTQIDVYGQETNDGNGYRQIEVKDIQAFEKLEDVKAVTTRKMLQQEGTYSIENYQLSTQTVVADFPSEIKAGFELSAGRLAMAKDEVVVGYHFPLNLSVKGETQKEWFDEKGQLKEEFRFNGELIGEKSILLFKK